MRSTKKHQYSGSSFQFSQTQRELRVTYLYSSRRSEECETFVNVPACHRTFARVPPTIAVWFVNYCTFSLSCLQIHRRKVDLLISEKDERSLSTTLLVTPEFALNNAEAFEVIGQT